MKHTITNASFDIALIGAFVTTIRRYVKDDRKHAERFATTYTTDKRRPEIFEAVKLAASKDDAADHVADTAIRDPVASANLANVDAETRTAWLDLVTPSLRRHHQSN